MVVANPKSEDPSKYPEVQAFLDSFSILIDDSDPNELTHPSFTHNNSLPLQPATPKDYPFSALHCRLQVMSDWAMQPYAGFLLYGQSADRTKTIGLQVSTIETGANLNDAAYVEKWKSNFVKQGYTFSEKTVKTLNGTQVLYTEGQHKSGDNVRSFAMILALANNLSYVLRVGVEGPNLPGPDLQDILNSFHIDP